MISTVRSDLESDRKRHVIHPADSEHGGTLLDIDFDSFWDDSSYSLDNYVEPSPSDALIASIEAELGYKLPAAFLELARRHNGGTPIRSCFPMDEPTGWADDHIAISGLYAIGRTATCSLCGERGALFMQREWGYPPIGFAIADTPSAGHELIMLDYRECGPEGEPHVVHVDQEADYRITVVAPDFATFIRGLVSADVFDTSEDDHAEAVATVEHGAFSPIVIRALAAAGPRMHEGERVLRALGRRIVDAKGHFSLHADDLSILMYGSMFWLYSQLATPKSFEDFALRAPEQMNYERPCYELMVVTGYVTQTYGFRTGGWAQDFVRAWWDASIARNDLIQNARGWQLAEHAEHELHTQWTAFVAKD
ncbi:MAG: SMI1/KNR4 family protein [Oxalobacteraceae bacterium]|nr:MAG: SMI1/KNR4 family protein [Oxalobacteraceae bacterium]